MLVIIDAGTTLSKKSEGIDSSASGTRRVYMVCNKVQLATILSDGFDYMDETIILTTSPGEQATIVYHYVTQFAHDNLLLQR